MNKEAGRFIIQALQELENLMPENGLKYLFFNNCHILVVPEELYEDDNYSESEDEIYDKFKSIFPGEDLAITTAQVANSLYDMSTVIYPGPGIEDDKPEPKEEPKKTSGKKKKTIKEEEKEEIKEEDKHSVQEKPEDSKEVYHSLLLSTLKIVKPEYSKEEILRVIQEVWSENEEI